jgi:hypothetical protein
VQVGNFGLNEVAEVYEFNQINSMPHGTHKKQEFS